MKIIIKLILLQIKFFEIFLDKFKKRYLSFFIYEKLREKYTEIKILNKKVKFFTPSLYVYNRVNDISIHEPQTQTWIKSFVTKLPNQNITFWDIGAAIGQFSIFASLVSEKISVFSFEASTKNLNILSTNLSINNLEDKISICPLPLGISTKVAMMKEKNNLEGKASNFLDTNFNKSKSINQYSIISLNIDFLINNKIINAPNFLKIDTDGTEREIIEGGQELLANKQLLEVQIELTENTKNCQTVIDIMQQHNFKLIKKFREIKYKNNLKYNKMFNYRFKRL